MRIRHFLLALALSASAKAVVPDAVVRHDFENVTGPPGKVVDDNVVGGGVIFSGGGSINHTSGILSGGGMQLRESSFGLPATAYLAPDEGFSREVLFESGLNGNPAVYEQLYPSGYKKGGVDGSRAQIQSGASAFRYKWLMFGQDPGGTPAILNLFEQTFGNTDDENNPWFNNTDRDKARDQIDVLREALAYSPLDPQLQSALLDVYYDLAVAEMQFVRKRQAKLATLRLGLTLDPLKPFIIDQEIDTYTALVEKTDGILADYGKLLSFEMEGFEPGDLDPAAGGSPFGYWLFQKRVPGRSQVETDLGTAKGPGIIRAIDRVATVTPPGANNDFTITGDASVPDNEADFLVMFSEVETLAAPFYDSATKTLTIPIITGTNTITGTAVNDVISVESLPQFTLANSGSDDGTGIISVKEDVGALNDPEDAEPATPVFAGYKDYRTLLTILGQNMQFRADLARLLGMRQATGDLTMARQLISKIQGPLEADFDALKHLFASVDFNDPQLDSSGVRGALTLVETAMTNSVEVRAFLNGAANVLGLDPNFLVLLPTQPDLNNPEQGMFDSYDIFVDTLQEVAPNGTGIGPLAIALDALLGSTNPSDPDGAVTAYTKFRENVTLVDQQLDGLESDYDGRIVEITGYSADALPSPWDGTPKPSTSSDLATVEASIESLKRQTAILGVITLQVLKNIATANEAVSIADGIDEVITGAQRTYQEKSASAWTEIHVWAGLAAGAQAAADTTFAITGASNFIAGAVAGGVGAYNTGIQTAAATRTSMREQELEELEMAYQTKVTLAEAPLTVKQAQLELGNLMRDALSNRFEIEDNFTAVAQAIADKTGYIREVERLTANLNADRGSLGEQYFADPIHYLRAERELLRADAEFRRAQRWVFYTARALEYKWQERFAYTVDPASGESYDIGRIFSARNASELKTIVQRMAQFDGDREATPGTRRTDRATISLRDNILTPNPADWNREFGLDPPDDGLRFEPSTGELVTTVGRFQNILSELQTTAGGVNSNGNIEITFDTSTLEFGQFFAGPNYLTCNSGLYRDKIAWLAVHFVFKDGATVGIDLVPAVPGNNGISGSMTYSGNTFFRTRVPPLPDRSPGTPSSADQEIASATTGEPPQPRQDLPGEFLIAPFRYYQKTDFTKTFEVSEFQKAPSTEFIFSSQSAETPAVETKIINTPGFKIYDFTERSVAATRWILQIDPNQFDIDDLLDIEIVFDHVAYVRPQINWTGTQ